MGGATFPNQQTYVAQLVTTIAIVSLSGTSHRFNTCLGNISAKHFQPRSTRGLVSVSALLEPQKGPSSFSCGIRSMYRSKLEDLMTGGLVLRTPTPFACSAQEQPAPIT